jgi:hypothetical protein
LVVAGLGIACVGVIVWVWAPEHTKFAPSATTADATAKVSDSSDTISTALIAAGILVFLVGANGRKIASIKVGGDELSFAEAASKAAATKAKKKALNAGLGAAEVKDAQDIATGDAFAKAIADPYAFDADSIAESAVEQAAPAH